MALVSPKYTNASDPATSAFSVTPHNTNNLPAITRGLYVGGTGNVVVILEGDTTAVTFTGLVAGVVHPLAVKRVLATNTTATNIVGVL